MKDNTYKLKAIIGLLLFLYFPFGYVFDLTQYTNTTAIFFLSILIGITGTLLVLPYIKYVFHLNEEEYIQSN